MAVSRAFGDRTLQPYVIADPHIEARPLDPDNDMFVYLASDGVTGEHGLARTRWCALHSYACSEISAVVCKRNLVVESCHYVCVCVCTCALWRT